jgi:uncharacterized protein YbjQ (UPF0145 family)
MAEFIVCGKCGKETFHTKSHCSFCGEDLASAKLDSERNEKLDYEARLGDARHHNDYSKLSYKEIEILSESVMVTTETVLNDYTLIDRVGIVGAECVLGVNIFKDFLSSVTDIVGGRSDALQKSLRDARKICLAELRKEALLLGSNAVIGVNFNYSEISGKEKSMLFLVATGTAVKLSP